MADYEDQQGLNATAAADAEIEAGRRLFARECRFMRGAVSIESLPSASLPEVAFAGRSNVGKSSLINSLTGRRDLARTSNTPGRTQEINFFDLAGRLILVDLPGHGFAQAPKTRVANWTALVERFLKGRSVLRRTCLLIDARHGIKDSDQRAMDVLDGAAQPYQLVLTKIDKITAAEESVLVATISKEIAVRPAAHPVILPTSSRTGRGIAELRAALASLAASAQEMNE